MGDWFSLSVLQILSIVSFVTSLFAVARAGSVTFGRWQHKFEANIQQPAANVAASVKIPLWSWKVSGLPVSFSLGSILGEDEEQDEGKDSMVGYDGGSTLVRMDWQLSRSATAIPQPQFTQPPLSMAKLIMTRHLQRKPGRALRRVQGSIRTPTRLSQSAVL
ncbi:hypothetical protein BDY19DRAFT_993148 [Irpex rosettiformis]|uniref:Uncharacterized protein n=1 Tax=Irpex rosettiformis TaxID=378272 RepID=A0ACB8U5V0_9APHY|nr:hypothetical protein BDY19DRAFT_993148 [Irpex rosettiformis]